MNFIIKTLEGLEPALAQEATELGALEVLPLTRAISCKGDLSFLYKANMMLRTAIKILVPITEVEVNKEEFLYNEIYALPWEKIFDLNQTFAIFATTNSNIFTNSQYAALKAKDAIVDRFRDKVGDRPNVNPLNPHISINIHIRERHVTVSLDSSGDSLHMRGYRMNSVDAPINEVLAAGMVLLSGWRGEQDFWDPMCGSGTIVIEAARIAAQIPPQKQDRSYLFENWANYNKELHHNLKNELYTTPSKPPISFYANDKSIQSVKATEINIAEAGLGNWIEVKRDNFFKHHPVANRTIITNPPYDERLELEDVKAFYKSIGDHFKQNCMNCDAWVISGNVDGIKALGLRPNKKYTLNNGAIESKFYNYKIYQSDEEEE